MRWLFHFENIFKRIHHMCWLTFFCNKKFALFQTQLNKYKIKRKMLTNKLHMYYSIMRVSQRHDSMQNLLYYVITW